MKLENVLLAIVLALGMFVIVAASIKTNPTESKANVVLADEREQAIISEMHANWSSKLAEEIIMYKKGFTKIHAQLHDYENENGFDKSLSQCQEHDIDEGRKRLKSDTVFLKCVRNDSLYKAMLNERKALARKLKVYQNRIPGFKAHIERICREIVEYNVDNGIYVLPAKDTKELFQKGKYYNSYTDLFKETLAVTDAQISDENIKTIFSLIKNIEYIDRHIWTIPEYRKREKEFEEKQAQEDRMRRIDSLTKAAS